MADAAKLLFFVAGLLSCVDYACADLEPKTMAVSLHTEWQSPTLLASASEAIGQISDDLYWEFLNQVFTVENAVATTDKDQYSLLLQAFEKMKMGDSFCAALNYSISIDYYTPKLQMYSELASSHVYEMVEMLQHNFNDSETSSLSSCSEDPIFFFGKKGWACSLQHFQDLFAKYNPEDDEESELQTLPSMAPFDFDRTLASSPDSPKVIMYADLTLPSTGAAHLHLRNLADSGKISYTLRPSLPKKPQGEKETLKLQGGYGIELSIKSQEYKVLDDDIPDLEEDSDAEADKEDEDVEIEGFYFAKLKERRPELKEKLDELRAQLLSQVDEAKAKVWDMQDLGVQCVARILRAQDPLAALRRISQDFPMYAPGLTKQLVNQTLKKDIAKLQEEFSSRNLLQVNAISLSPTDVFELHDALLPQSLAADSLQSLGLSGTTIREIMGSWKSADSGNEAMPGMMGMMGMGSMGGDDSFLLDLDVGHQALIWLNDLESGGFPYNRWSPSVREFMTPAWPNQLRFIAKNLYRLVLVADPTSLEGLSMLTAIRELVQQNAPVTAAVIFDLREKSDDEDKSESDAEAPLSVCSDSEWPAALLDEEWAKSLRKKCDAKNKGLSKEEASDEISLREGIARTFYILAGNKDYGSTAAWEYISEIANLAENKSPKGRVTKAKARKAFRKTASKSSLKKKIKTVFAMAFKSEFSQEYADVSALVASSKSWIARKGLGNSKYTTILNGKLLQEVPPMAFRRMIMTSLLMQQMSFQQAVYQEELTDDTDIDEYVRTKPNTFSRINTDILNEDAKTIDSLKFPTEPISYLPLPIEAPDSSMSFTPLTMWIVSDFSTTLGRSLIAAGLDYWESGSVVPSLPSRVAIFDNPSSEQSPIAELLAETITATLANSKALAILSALLRSIQDEDILTEGLEAIKKTYGTTEVDSNTLLCGEFCKKSLEIQPGEMGIVCNTRLVKVSQDIIQSKEEIEDQLFEDLRLLDAFIGNFLRLEDLTSALNNEKSGAEESKADQILAVSHIMSKVPRSKGDSETFPDSEALTNVLIYSNPDAFFSVRAVIDPLTHDGQKLSSILLLLRDALNVDLTVYLSPSLEISEVPLKRFYRFAVGGWSPDESTMNGEIPFAADGARVRAGGLVFRNIRSRALLTMSMQVPDGWQVASKLAPHDLDNILLDDLSTRSTVEYNVEHLLLEGQCLDADKQEPPAGLQLELANVSNSRIQDTIVMYNLGYWQLKAGPGVWRVRVPPNRHGDIYSIEGSQKDHSGAEFKLFPVYSFQSAPSLLRMHRRKGMERADLLEEVDEGGAEDTPGGLLDKISSLLSGNGDGSKDKVSTKGKKKSKIIGGGGDTVHVFSLASGQLYERFLKIMMQSVVKNTDSKVKFWFLSNFLSPQFKEFVPMMAAKLGFEVEFVTYQWPKWLHRQTTRQRIIWGYKILFLDVLFPLNLRRIIYIDADQVVRGDVKELWDMDLKGSPYGYTPFCDSNTKTKGFRFWDSGYWKSHLRGKPYHISALYVVDLARFRRMRAGDTLRSVYDNLSADPNSLANLDQDLPNYAQHTVPIFSLPQEWLWCETWCSMETLPTAKTIDLCNNPLTKKPKLEVARELLPEWTIYDERHKSMS